MAQSARIDYFRATTTDPVLIKWQSQGYFSDENTELVQIPLYGYRRTLKHSTSGAFYCATPHTDAMGNMVQFSGSPISAVMAETGCASVRVPFETGTQDWKVTRLDIAIDYFDAPVTMDAFYERVVAEKYISKIRIWEREKVALDGGKDIIRGGGKDATRSIKVYDKAAEQKLPMKWTQYEMTFTDARAREMWAKVRELSDDAELLTFAKKVMATMIDFPDWKEWQEAFGVASTHEWTPIPRTQSDQWRWLLRQVAPAFRDDFFEKGDWRLLEQFIQVVKESAEKKD